MCVCVCLSASIPVCIIVFSSDALMYVLIAFSLSLSLTHCYSSSGCVVFELKSGDRVFAFTAESSFDMLQWVNAISEGVKGAKEMLRRLEIAKVAAVTPEKIRLIDEKGAIALADFVADECSHIFPSDDEVAGQMTLDRRLKAAAKIVEYVETMKEEVKLGDGNTRYDVLAIGLVEVNRLLTARLAEAVSEVT